MKLPITIGLDLGGTFLKFGVVGEAESVLYRARLPVDPTSAETVFSAIGDGVREARERVPSAAAVGLGIPGILDLTAQVIRNSPNLHCLDGRPLDPLMRSACPLPYVIDNDANCAAWGEYVAGAGHGSDWRSFVLLTVGTGVGGGIILDRKLWHGARGFAGEPGHMVIERDGRPCNCGGRGCLETRVSAGALVEAYVGHGGERVSSEDVAQRAAHGDARARAAFEEVGRDLGIGLAAIINLLNPDAIAVGGGVMGAGELLLGPAREEAARRAFADSYRSVHLLPARLGNDAGLIGAALRARETVV